MSSTLQPTAELSNAAPALTPEQDELCHAAQVPERSDLTPVPLLRTEAGLPIENSSHLTGCTVQAPVPRDSRGVGSSAGADTLRDRSRRDDLDRPRFKLGTPTRTGFKFGPGRFANSPKVPETNLPRIVDGESIAKVGYELLTHGGGFVAWFECVLDAFESLKNYRGPGKVVRCADRALLKHRPPRKERAW